VAADSIKIQIDVGAKDAIKELMHVQKWTQEVAAAAKKAAEEENKLGAEIRKAEIAALAAATKLAAEATKQLAAESKALGVSIEKLKSDIASTIETTTKLKEKNDAADQSAKDLRSTFVTLTTDVGALGERFSKTHPILTSFAGTVGRLTLGVTAGVGAIGAATMSLAQHAAQSESSDRAIRLLGDAYGQVQDATMGTVNAQSALRVQQGLVQSGLEVTGSQLAIVSRAARDYALATGTETGQALDQMADALRGMEAEGLRRFNISVQSSGDRTRDFNAALEQLSRRQAQTGVENRTMSEEITRSTDAMGRFIGSLASGISRALELRQAFSWAADLLDPEVQRRNLQGDSLLRAAAERARQRGSTLERIQQAERAGLDTSQLRAAMSTRGVSLEDMSRIGAFAEEGARRTVSGGAGAVARQQAVLAEAITPALRAQMQLAMDTQNISDSTRAKAGESARAADRLTKSTEGAAAALTVFERVSNRIAGMMQRAQSRSFAGRAGVSSLGPDEFGDLLGEIAAPRADELAAIENERSKLEAAFAEDRAGVTRGRERTQRRATRDRETRSQALQQDRSLGGGMLRGLGVTGDALQTESRLMQGYSDMAVGALGKISDAFTKHIELVISGQETIGQALLAGTNEVSLALAREALPRSLMELAAGFAALGNPLTVATAPAHFTSAAIYGSVAAGAGLVAGVTGAAMAGNAPPGASGAANQASARAASGRSLPSGNDKAAPITLVVSSLVPPGPRELQALVHANRQAGRYGIDRKAPRQVRA